MTNDQINIAIAELCGWEPVPEGHFHPDNPIGQTPPSYTTDLNAMHEVEATLQWIETDAYLDTLARIVDSTNGYRMELTFAVAAATAAQRAEAFLRVHGKWI